MTDLEGEIRYWEAKLKHEKAYLVPAETALIEGTIRHLKELKKIKGGVSCGDSV
ncbi:hypothetical protein ES707_11961 [subsurface metagenome]